jgi:hypothetical protein
LGSPEREQERSIASFGVLAERELVNMSLFQLYPKHEYENFVEHIIKIFGKKELEDFLAFHTDQVINDLKQIKLPTLWELWNTRDYRKHLYQVRNNNIINLSYNDNGNYISFTF